MSNDKIGAAFGHVNMLKTKQLWYSDGLHIAIYVDTSELNASRITFFEDRDRANALNDQFVHWCI